MNFELALSSHFLIYIRDYFLDHDLDSSLIEGFEEALNDVCNNHHLPLSLIAQIYEDVVAITGNENLGMDIAKGYHYESTGMIVLLMLTSTTVEQCLKTLIKYDRYFDSAIDIDLDIGLKRTTFSCYLINPTDFNVSQINEYLMVFIPAIFAKSTRKKMPIKEVWFQHKAYKDSKKLEQFFGCKVLFGQATNQIIFDSHFLGQKQYSTNPRLYEILSQQIRGFTPADSSESKFMEAICREIVRQGKSDTPSIDSVASSLALSGRTLRRRLSEHGYTFQEVKNLAREKQAKYFLEHTSISLSEIALELGFSELSAFSRAYRSWTGETPQAYRDS